MPGGAQINCRGTRVCLGRKIWGRQEDIPTLKTTFSRICIFSVIAS